MTFLYEYWPGLVKLLLFAACIVWWYWLMRWLIHVLK